MIRIETGVPEERERGLAAAAAAARRGQLVGLPLDVAYGVAADAFSERGTQALRAAKGRSDLAIPVMVARMATVSGIAEVSAEAKELMRDFWPGPLTLVLRAQKTLAWSLTDPSGRIAVRMPLHPVALELLARTGPLGVVAAAVPPGPGLVTVAEAFPDALAAHLDVLLDAGGLPGGTPSAVIDLSGGVPVLVRPGPQLVEALREACPSLVVPSAGPGEPDP